MLLSVIYWTLSFNQLKVPYVGREAGIPILFESAWEAERLANVAFTYAISTLPSNASIHDFVVRVNERYQLFKDSGWINGEELHRVASAIAVHCIGWSGWVCNSSDYHKTVWQKRPALFTGKSSFALNNPFQMEEFIRAEDLELVYGAPQLISHGTSGDGYGYRRLGAYGDELCTLLTIPIDGTYRVHGAVRAPGAGDELNVWIYPPGPWKTWKIESTGSWHWSHSAPTFSVTGAPKVVSVCLRHEIGNVIDVDAILVRKQ